jgi:hypothetical protein
VFSAFYQWNRHAKRVTALSRLKKTMKIGRVKMRYGSLLTSAMFFSAANFTLGDYLIWMDDNKLLLLVNIQLLFKYPLVESRMEIGNSSIPWSIQEQRQSYPGLNYLRHTPLRCVWGVQVQLHHS